MESAVFLITAEVLPRPSVVEVGVGLAGFDPAGQLAALRLDRAACGEVREEVLACFVPAGQHAALLLERAACDAVVDDVLERFVPAGQHAALLHDRAACDVVVVFNILPGRV